MPTVSGLEERFAGRIAFVMFDWDDPTHNDQRRELEITDRAQYVVASADGEVVKRWYGVLNEEQVGIELEELLTS